MCLEFRSSMAEGVEVMEAETERGWEQTDAASASIPEASTQAVPVGRLRESLKGRQHFLPNGFRDFSPSSAASVAHSMA